MESAENKYIPLMMSENVKHQKKKAPESSEDILIHPIWVLSSNYLQRKLLQALKMHFWVFPQERWAQQDADTSNTPNFDDWNQLNHK